MIIWAVLLFVRHLCVDDREPTEDLCPAEKAVRGQTGSPRHFKPKTTGCRQLLDGLATTDWHHILRAWTLLDVLQKHLTGPAIARLGLPMPMVLSPYCSLTGWARYVVRYFILWHIPALESMLIHHLMKCEVKWSCLYKCALHLVQTWYGKKQPQGIKETTSLATKQKCSNNFTDNLTFASAQFLQCTIQLKLNEMLSYMFNTQLLNIPS